MDFDVVVVGAGPGGCIAARDLARAGFQVGLFDSDTRENLGKTVIIEAEKVMFDTVSVTHPNAEEIPYHPKSVRIFSGRGKEAFVLQKELPSYGIYLDRMVKRFRADAEKSGAKFFGGFRALGPVVSEGRVAGVVFQNREQKQEARARLVIDATGFNAALLRKLDPGLGIEFEEKPGDIVVAANQFCEIDPAKAEQAVSSGRRKDEEVWNYLSPYGSYSTRYSHLSVKNKRAYILVGLKADYDMPAPDELIERFKREQGYYGKSLYRGKGSIRIRHSLERLVADGFMAIGEAACQVIPAHGSGVSSAMYAGHLAAQAAIPALSKGQATTAELWPYAREYQSGRGAVLATLSAVRLMADSLSQDQLAAMLEQGIMTEDDLSSAFVPAFAKISISSFPRRIIGFAKNSGVIRPMARTLKAVATLRFHYGKYPRAYDPQEFAAWKEKTKRIFSSLGY